MSALARSVDQVIGTLSRFLHVRPARLNTVDDLGPYLGASSSVLFPPPRVPPVTVVRSPVRRWHSCSGAPVIEALEWRSEHVPLCPRYQSRHEGEYASNQRVVARWMHPASGPRRRALVYVHGWLEPGPWVEQTVLLPRLYDALGVDVLHVQLPFHGSRNPKGSLFHGEFFWTADLVRSFEAVRQSCIDSRTLVAWLRDRGYTEVGVTGISMGGSIAMLLACLEPQTPDYVVPIVGHLQLADAVEHAPIFWRMKRDLEGFRIDRARREEIFGQLGLAGLAPVVPPERQLWIMARDDMFVTAPLVERQWRDWGRPPIVWIPGGHMTFPLSLGRIVESMRDFHATLPEPQSYVS
ncbi:MAG TPA: alpha/beta hydrolase family protein [Polyangiaceae bacterium]|nr:alpha/beta hydrolase family protein [Polyangiaceae bacterium]